MKTVEGIWPRRGNNVNVIKYGNYDYQIRGRVAWS